jgi:uncharacterized membrane protein
VESGKWKVESGKWKVESEKWKVKSGKWKVESGKCAALSEVEMKTKSLTLLLQSQCRMLDFKLIRTKS